MIQVCKKWYIDSDGQQYILFKKVKYVSPKDGEEKERQSDYSYHSTVSSALSYLLRRLQMKKVKQEDMSLKEAIEMFNKLEKLLIKSANGKEI